MNRLMINMSPMIPSLIAHADAYRRSHPLAGALAAHGANPGNETDREQRPWI